MDYFNQNPVYSQIVQSTQLLTPPLREHYGEQAVIRAGGSYNQFLPDDSPDDTKDCCGCVILKMNTWGTPYNDAMSECLNEGYCSRNPPGGIYNCTGMQSAGQAESVHSVVDTARDED